MPRFIVRFRGAAPNKDSIAKTLHEAPSIHVLNDTGRMLLLEADEDDLLKIVRPTPDVLIVQESHYELPDKRPSVKPEPSKK